jgi:hypothetical protein
MSSTALQSAAIAGHKRNSWTANFLKRLNNKLSILAEVRMDGCTPFRNFTRMTASNFVLLLQLIGPSVKKQDTGMRAAIPINTRLAVCDLAYFSHSNCRYLCQQ